MHPSKLSRSPGDTETTAIARPGAPGKSTATSRLIARRRDGNGVADDAERAVEQAASSSGEPLPGELRDRFESSLGADLSGVRVHTGAASAQAARAVGARAYATGNDVHFAAGQYDPQSAFGVHLLAHEVAHTVQQQGGAPSRQHKLEVSGAADSAEREADRAADAMVSGAPVALGGGGAGVQRKEGEPEAPATPAPAEGAPAAAAATPRFPKWKGQTISLPILDKIGGSFDVTYGDKPSVGVKATKGVQVPLFDQKYGQDLQIAPGAVASLTGAIKGSVGASLAVQPQASWAVEPGEEEQSCTVGVTGSGEVAFTATGSITAAAGVGIANVLSLQGGLKGAITAKVGGSASIGGSVTKKPDGSESGAIDFKVGVEATLSAAASIVADVVIPGDRINVYERVLGKLDIGKATVGVHATYANGETTHHPLAIQAEWFPVPPLEDRATRLLTKEEREKYFPSEVGKGASGGDAATTPDGPESIVMNDEELFAHGKEQAAAKLGALQGQVVPMSGHAPGLGGMVYGSTMVDGVAVRSMVEISSDQQQRDRAEGRQLVRVTHGQVQRWSTLGTPTVELVGRCAKTPDAVCNAYLANHVELTLIGAAFDYRQVAPRMGTCKTDGSLGVTAEPEPPPVNELENPGDQAETCDPEAASCEGVGPRAE